VLVLLLSRQNKINKAAAARHVTPFNITRRDLPYRTEVLDYWYIAHTLLPSLVLSLPYLTFPCVCACVRVRRIDSHFVSLLVFCVCVATATAAVDRRSY